MYQKKTSGKITTTKRERDQECVRLRRPEKKGEREQNLVGTVGHAHVKVGKVHLEKVPVDDLQVVAVGADDEDNAAASKKERRREREREAKREEGQSAERKKERKLRETQERNKEKKQTRGKKD